MADYYSDPSFLGGARTYDPGPTKQPPVVYDSNPTKGDYGYTPQSSYNGYASTNIADYNGGGFSVASYTTNLSNSISNLSNSISNLSYNPDKPPIVDYNPFVGGGGRPPVSEDGPQTTNPVGQAFYVGGAFFKNLFSLTGTPVAPVNGQCPTGTTYGPNPAILGGGAGLCYPPGAEQNYKNYVENISGIEASTGVPANLYLSFFGKLNLYRKLCSDGQKEFCDPYAFMCASTKLDFFCKRAGKGQASGSGPTKTGSSGSSGSSGSGSGSGSSGSSGGGSGSGSSGSSGSGSTVPVEPTDKIFQLFDKVSNLFNSGAGGASNRVDPQILYTPTQGITEGDQSPPPQSSTGMGTVLIILAVVGIGGYYLYTKYKGGV